MAIVVQKYGGSSVADVDRIGRVAELAMEAQRKGDDVVVVVSAMGKATDELLGLAMRVAPLPPRRELDMLVSTGERVTMALLSMAIQARGGAAISFTGSQSGIITDDRHFDARIIEVRPHRIHEELARGHIVIVAGYQGVSHRREVTTLGRGGSDTTAAALAAALGAERCEIYSDVDGVYSADPRVVPEAIHLPRVDVAFLAEMAESGAKVINAQAVEWARRANVAIHARRTSDRPGEGRETVCLASGARSSARAVVGLDRVVHATFEKGSSFRKFAEVAADLGLPLMDVAAGRSGACCAIPLANVPDWDGCRSRLADALGDAASFETHCAVVSLVGEGLTSGRGLCWRRCLPGAGSAGRRGSGGARRASSHASSATIPASHLAQAQRALHGAFVLAQTPLDQRAPAADEADVERRRGL